MTELHTRADVIKAAKEAANIISSTYGPNGRLVLFDGTPGLRDGKPRASKDGVTIATLLSSDDKATNLGYSLVKDACLSTNGKRGDGTTLTAILTSYFLKEYASLPPVKAIAAIEKDEKTVLEQLKKHTLPINKKRMIAVATIAGNNDQELGKAIGSLAYKLGSKGKIMAEYANQPNVTVERKPGYTAKGKNPVVVSPFQLPNPASKLMLENVRVVLIHDAINDQRQIVELLKKFESRKFKGEKYKGEDILIIAGDLSGDALDVIVTNHATYKNSKGAKGINVWGIRNPYSGTEGLDYLLDIAHITGAKVLSSRTGYSLRAANDKRLDEFVGWCERAGVSSHELVIFGKEPTKEYLNSVEGERRSKLKDGVTIVKIGGSSEVEQIENGTKVDDIIGATQSAWEGVVPGGGYVFQKAGINAPTNLLAEHAGIEPPVFEDKGFDFKRKEWVDKDAILNAASVVREALKSAVSVSKVILRSEHVITL